MGNNAVEKRLNTPLYEQVRNFILEKIKDNTYKKGKAIPPERELCEQLGISRHTLRKGIDQLVHEGILYRIQREGTFVFKNNTKKNLNNNTIGVVITSSQESLNSQILNGINKAASKNNVNISLVDSEDDLKKEAQAIQKYRKEGLKGLIIIPVSDYEDSLAIIDLKREQIPFVLVDRRLHGCLTNCVMSDNVSGAYEATKYLLELGHENIAFLNGNPKLASSITDRITGYKEALSNYNIEHKKELVHTFDLKEMNQEVKDEIYNYIKTNEITAIVSSYDLVAANIMKLCIKRGMKIPRDLSIIGFDNRSFSKLLEVPLTTVAQYPIDIGERAFELLLKIINGENNTDSELKQIYYKTKLIIRESCAEINRDNFERNVKKC